MGKGWIESNSHMVHKFRSSSLKRMTAQARELATTVGAVMGCTRVNAEGVGCGRALEHAVHCPNFCTILCLKSIARVAMQLIIIKAILMKLFRNRE